MDVDVDVDVEARAWLVLPAALVTLLALLAAAVFLNRTSVLKSSRDEHEPTRPRGAPASRTGRENAARSQELRPGEETESQSRAHTDQNLEDDPRTSQQTAEDRKCESVARNKSGDPPSVEGVAQEEQPLRYRPGMLRTSQLEKMMSREELEEERRVQQEQLAAIFKLLKENQDTFGEISEKDMEEQLKLYSI